MSLIKCSLRSNWPGNNPEQKKRLKLSGKMNSWQLILWPLAEMHLQQGTGGGRVVQGRRAES